MLNPNQLSPHPGPLALSLCVLDHSVSLVISHILGTIVLAAGDPVLAVQLSLLSILLPDPLGLVLDLGGPCVLLQLLLEVSTHPLPLLVPKKPSYRTQ